MIVCFPRYDPHRRAVVQLTTNHWSLTTQQDSRSRRLRVMRSTVLSRPLRPLAHSVHPVVNTVPPRL